MTDWAIQIEGLSKLYRIGRTAASYRTARESIEGWFKRRSAEEQRREELWALSEVSVEIPQGATVGLIGPNGAGKSTLLKILSRITRPTSGRARFRGRVASLLEVGTGFHPELTGRENVYFNGALLGMRKRDIDRQLDQIVSFAGTERFLDTPVKHYSSGMQTRLAFAVAAHLQADILLVDEVLAVGDAAFQRKCLGRMNEVARDGKTVIFVSHDMTNVAVLCETAILLDRGKVQDLGPSKRVIEGYLSRVGGGDRESCWDRHEAPGNETVRLTRVRALDHTGNLGPVFQSQPVTLAVEYVVERRARLNPVFVVKNAWGVVVFSTANYEDPEWGKKSHSAGSYEARCRVPAYLLNSGAYTVDALLVQDTRHVLAQADHAVTIEVHDEGSMRSDYAGEWVGVVRPRCLWETSEIGAAEPVMIQVMSQA
jgi:lipopolysaccharide transport system ATP-binding protein